jgi:four helix bundle protein
MKIEKFEDLQIWQKAKTATVDIYTIFRSSKDFAFRDQIQRASVSIMNNIAEGFERRGNKEFNHFLSIAKGSAGEVWPIRKDIFETTYEVIKEQG